MIHLRNNLSLLGRFLTFAMLLAVVTPADAGSLNGTSMNGTSNGSNVSDVKSASKQGRGTPGSAVADLNGVKVEAAIVPGAARR